MTLLQLLKQIRRIEDHFTTTDGIPLKMYGYDIDIILGLQQDDNGNYIVNVELIPDAKQFQQMLSERVDYEVKIKRDIHLESQCLKQFLIYKTRKKWDDYSNNSD